MDRVHRIGQRESRAALSTSAVGLTLLAPLRRPADHRHSPHHRCVSLSVIRVLATLLTSPYTENSIESRILDLQKKKEDLAASALGDDDAAMGRVRFIAPSSPLRFRS